MRTILLLVHEPEAHEAMTRGFYVRAVETVMTAIKVFDPSLDQITMRR